VVAAVAIICIIFGFLLGTRAKQLIKATKNAGKALISLRELLKSGAEDEEKDDGEAEAVDDQVELDDSKPEEFLDEFFSMEITSGLDDHADIIRNPILMYHIKIAKDEQRREKRRQQLLADGVDEETVNQVMENEMMGLGGSGGGGDGKQNALATLIAAGARVTSVGDSSTAEAAAAEERRRNARTIDTFLSKQRGIDVKKTTRPQGGASKLAMSALDMAYKTSKEPYGGQMAKLTEQKVDIAKQGRVSLRAWQRTRKEIVFGEGERRSAKQAADLLSTDMQSALLAELEGGDEEDEDDDLDADGRDGEDEDGLDA